MGKESLASKAEDRQEIGKKKEWLSDGFTDLRRAKEYLKECDHKEADLDGQILYLLIDISLKKIDYFERKYGFKIDADDIFYIEDVFDFFRKAEELRVSREKQA